MDNQDLNQIISEWTAVKATLDAAKEREKVLRDKLVELNFAGSKPGTNRVKFDNGCALKAVIKYNYSIKKNEAVEPADYSHVPRILERMRPECAFGLVRWKPELSESKYKELPEDQRLIFNECLLITNGSATLELEYPKKKA